VRLHGSNDGEAWTLETEVDRMSVREPFTVSVWVGPTFVEDDTEDAVCGAFLSPSEARQLAHDLVRLAAAVEVNNLRVGAT